MAQVFNQPDSDPRQFGDKENQGRQESNSQQDEKRRNSANNEAEGTNDGLSEEELPDSTNENKGATGSGQRQDSN